MGPFVSLLAKTYGLPESSVAVVARVLREAGWLTTGPRGVNAPEMQALDAARLTLALMTGQPPSKVLQDFEVLRLLQTNHAYPREGLMAKADLNREHRFEDALAALFRISQDRAYIESFGERINRHIFRAPKFSVSVDAASLGSKLEYPKGSAEYRDIAAEVELKELGKLSFSLETWERTQQLENRSRGWDSNDPLPGRGMRAIRTITNEEIIKISEAMAKIDDDAKAELMRNREAK